MKIKQAEPIQAFGGINFVYLALNNLSIPKLLDAHLPSLANQSKYNWRDIFYSLLSIYFTGGDCIEDIQGNLSSHFGNNPMINLPSPDRLLARMKQLEEPIELKRTQRGTIDHQVSSNQLLSKLNIALLKQLGVFNEDNLVLDYDNTILFTEKSDSKRTYKREKGYQPAVITLNVNHIAYIENRNGNTDAKSLQTNTLTDFFTQLSQEGINTFDSFRADAASYQFAVIELVKRHVTNFYIGARHSYVQPYFKTIDNWEQTTDSNNQTVWIGSTTYTPFISQSKKAGIEPHVYRLIVKRKLKRTKQIDCFTGDCYDYTAIITNDFTRSAIETFAHYNQRGSMEKQFDVTKNDFGWNHLPFSKMEQNTVFMYLTAMIKNLYNKIIKLLSEKIDCIESSFRMKKLIFRFITMPAKWIRSGRQSVLRVFTSIPLEKVCFKT